MVNENATEGTMTPRPASQRKRGGKGRGGHRGGKNGQRGGRGRLRRNVGLVIINAEGKVLAGLRSH